MVKYVLRLEIPNYSAYLLVAFLSWTFFQMALMDASQSVLMHHDLLKKVYFPREVLPLSTVIANLIHFLLSLAVFFVYLLVLGVPISINWLLLPVLVGIEFLLVVGISLFISCLNVFYEDIKYIVSVMLNIFFYLTPIMYMSELVRNALTKHGQGWLFTVYQLNPLNAIVISFRKLLLPPYTIPAGRSIASQFKGLVDTPLDWRFPVIAAAVSFVIAVLGYAYFNYRKWSFAEQL
jgi:ABC-type polysaccharide/polyol phosphate export permease